jgi:hypothetical protein
MSHDTPRERPVEPTPPAPPAWPAAALASGAILLGAAAVLRLEGRVWFNATGRPFAWTPDAWSGDTSQALFDPYSLTHVLHGVVFCWALAWLAREAPAARRFLIALGVEALWEIAENSAYVIDRYRTATAALGYTGDTIGNSLGDVLSCAVGFLVARRVGPRWSAALFAASELLLLVTIRDCLLLNVLMLLYPIDAVRAWQQGR